MVLDGGEVAYTSNLVKIPKNKFEAWDKEHDAQGGKIGSGQDDQVVVTETVIQELEES